MHNFADDNTLSIWGELVSKLIDTLESESEIAINWFTKNEMIINPDKFQAIILDKNNSNLANILLTLDNETIKSVPSVELLGIHLDDNLNFNMHLTDIFRSAANQLNALIRLKPYLDFNAKRALINSYIIQIIYYLIQIIYLFNYCLLVWVFSTAKYLKKIESLQKRGLQFLYKDHSTSYEGLLEKARKVKMSVNTLRYLCAEIYKTINKLNLECMNKIFQVNKRLVREQYKLNLETPEWNQVTFESKSLKVHGRKVWNSLPFHIKTPENLIQFRSLIKNWNGNSCSCTVCTKKLIHKFYFSIRNFIEISI